jgi:hypothetical protein
VVNMGRMGKREQQKSVLKDIEMSNHAVHSVELHLVRLARMLGAFSMVDHGVSPGSLSPTFVFSLLTLIFSCFPDV